MAKEPFDLTSRLRYGLEGRIITMDAATPDLPSGIIYIDGDTIVAVKPTRAAPPPGFSKEDVIKSGGTIYPGLIELHNHISYNILPLWHPPKSYKNRDEWPRHKDYRKLVSGPVSVIGGIERYIKALVRLVECKCLFGGVTTTQGISLYSNKGIEKYYRGLVRNVERPEDDERMPAARTKIQDVEAGDAGNFLEALRRAKCLLLHLSEGIDDKANEHFKALEISHDEWAITDSLAGIHSTGLWSDDWKVMARHKGSVVWSPLSNLLLYGRTTDIATARQEGVLIGMGSDWSVSGSKHLMCELKVADLVNREAGRVFTDRELVEMVTINAARILKWEGAVGSIAPGKKADLLVLRGRRGDDPLRKLIEARETDVEWVVIGGVPRYGQPRLMRFFRAPQPFEEVPLGNSRRYFYLEHSDPETFLVDISYREAVERLQEGMARLPELARRLEEAKDSGTEWALAAAGSEAGGEVSTGQWMIVPDHYEGEHRWQRHHILYGSDRHPTGGALPAEEGAVQLSEILEPLVPDEGAITNDRDYFRRLARQLNLPDFVKVGLPAYYGQSVDLNSEAELLNSLGPATASFVDYVQYLPDFYLVNGMLTPMERELILDQAILLFEQVYVHHYLKSALHASNPVAALQALKSRNRLEYLPEIDFHKEILRIFNSVRDLHTNYLLPAPFREKVAFLPFFVEEYFDENGDLRFMVSKTIGKLRSDHFREGVELLYWNGVPLARAVHINGDRYAGSNTAARWARGLDTLTFRPLNAMLPPEEEWVDLQYLDAGGKRRTIRFKWLVLSRYSRLVREREEAERQALGAAHVAMGYDYQASEVNKLKKMFFAPQALLFEQTRQKGERIKLKDEAGYLETAFPEFFRPRIIPRGEEKYGYLRIFSFQTTDADAFHQEFVRLLKKMPPKGLIIDVRGNGGGNIIAAERLLQPLSAQPVTPQKAQFIISTLVEEICRKNSPSKNVPGLDLSRWYDSIRRLKQVGATFSGSYPITDPKMMAGDRQVYHGPVLLVTDALCYSATDIFVAGFQDHGIGRIIGASANVGAGGANVWSYRLLQILEGTAEGEAASFKALPKGADFRVATRRTLRAGEFEGIPLEDLGVQPDYLYKMTKNDLLNGNEDLITFAIEQLQET